MAIKIVEPAVYLVGVQQVDEDEIQSFLFEEGIDHWETDEDEGGQKLVEVAGRLCYMSFVRPRPGGNKAFIGHILESGHGSVLEHAVYSLIITGVSRSFTHELVRHRVGFSYSQLSQRYVDESECSFVEPEVISSDPELHRKWLSAIEMCQETYRELSNSLAKKFAHIQDKTLSRKRAREAARSILPNATETKIFVTANVRALRHFIEVRCDLAADSEIRRVALGVLRVLRKDAPNLFGDYVLKGPEDDEWFLETKYRKV